MSARDETTEAPDTTAEDREIRAETAVDQMLLYAFDQAVEMLEQGSFEPFTILLRDDEFFIEEHSGEEIEACYASARRSIHQMALVASDYVFCYDGYVDLDEGRRDAVIVERAHRGAGAGEVFAMLYEQQGSSFTFDETLYGIGDADNYFDAGVGGGAGAGELADDADADAGGGAGAGGEPAEAILDEDRGL
ncbi:MAG: hypothetical protein LBO07_00835 [Coriobacteriales bacterium]|jgi:hypothetical protein|nr:hypothetical protein [Coriobacteriales bacterium]